MHTVAGIVILVGLLVGASGSLIFMGGAASDDPEVGDATGARGCVLMLFGIASLIAGCFWLAH